MKVLSWARSLRSRRPVFVTGLGLLMLLTAGVTAVFAGSSSRITGSYGPLPRATAMPALVGNHVTVGHSYENDVTQPLRAMPRLPYTGRSEAESSPNPRPVSRHRDELDTARQTKQFAPDMPGTTLTFEGIPFPGVNCNCAPPDTNGEVGATQYVQLVNVGLQVFNKATGASV